MDGGYIQGICSFNTFSNEVCKLLLFGDPSWYPDSRHVCSRHGLRVLEVVK